MVTLSVEFTDDQYARYKAALESLLSIEEATDTQLIAQLKREASAITYAAEIGSGDGTGWSY